MSHGTYKIKEAKADVRVLKAWIPQMTKIAPKKEEGEESNSEEEDEPDQPVAMGFGESM